MKKVLAVIPARAGSKSIPNKNIRLVNGKPLITYTIENAKKSNFITDIVITTDSTEIKIIAKQMGIRTKDRSEELCQDHITLDPVIYDAIAETACDYVITLQPTSPTLQAETLDRAITYAINHNLDTLISVINAPHLSWREEHGIKIPNYEKRLNRQELPPCYLETGAFVISKASAVTEYSRIGKSVDVFEISEQESIDIDTFEDLNTASSILQQKKVAIYVNGNNQRGVGHIYRALELADEFYTRPDIYFDINQTNIKVFGTTTHNLIGINGIGELLELLKTQKYDIFINDILTTTIDYMIAVRNVLPDTKIINFEDDGEGTCKADLVFNALYEKSDLPQIYSGEKYYIASKLFLFYEPIKIVEQVKRVFISFGGADPQNYSDRLLNIITQDKYLPIEFIVVLGRAKNNIKELMKFNKFPNIKVFYDVANMPELMSSCDIGVTSRGRTGYELAILGIPSIAMAQNKREEKHGFVSNDNGFNYLGLNPSDYVIESNLDMYIKMSQEERARYQSMLLSNNLRDGRKRVMNLIHSL